MINLYMIKFISCKYFMVESLDKYDNWIGCMGIYIYSTHIKLGIKIKFKLNNANKNKNDLILYGK